LAKNAEVLKAAFHGAGFDYAERLYHGNPDADGIKPLAVHNQEWVTEGALEFMEQNKDRPFFLYMATTIPHGPFKPERSWRSAVPATPEGILDQIAAVQSPRETIDTRLKEAGISTWNSGAVLWLDDAMTAIVEKLEALGIDDNTIIIFASDHGTEAKGGAYLGGTLTAALVWKKGGFPVGTTTKAQLQLTDLAPTILDWAGVDYRGKKLDGKSFSPVLEGTTDKIHDSLYFEMGYSRAVIKDGFKYLALRYPEEVKNMTVEERTRRLEASNEKLRQRGRPLPTEDPTAPFSHLFLIPGGHDVDQVAIKSIPGFFDADQLYDLGKDPGEQTNLAGDEAYAERLEMLKQELAKYVERLPQGFGEFGGESK
jgi:arylsulfatase A-like enzyme